MTDEEGYDGPAVVVVDESEVDVTVVLRGYFEPIDGHYHWYGRIGVSERLRTLVGGKNKPAMVRTPLGAAPGQLSDPDTWGRYRIAGTGRPPFTVATTLAEVEHG
jgi:hypothetical protein